MSEHNWFKKFMGMPLTEQTDKYRWCSIVAWAVGVATLFALIKVVF